MSLNSIVILYNRIRWDEKLAVFIEFKNEILWPYGPRMRENDLMISIKGKITLDVILQPAKNLMFLLNFSFHNIKRKE
jgi:hypothetical protein